MSPQELFVNWAKENWNKDEWRIQNGKIQTTNPIRQWYDVEEVTQPRSIWLQTSEKDVGGWEQGHWFWVNNGWHLNQDGTIYFNLVDGKLERIQFPEVSSYENCEPLVRDFYLAYFTHDDVLMLVS